MYIDENPYKIPITINDKVYLNTPYQDLAPYVKGVVIKLEYNHEIMIELATVLISDHLHVIPTKYLSFISILPSPPSLSDNLFE